MRVCSLIIVSFSLCFLTLGAYAADSLVEFDNPEHALRYQELLKEYRCLKCQNQNLADSNADLAQDLRREIYLQVVSEQPKAAIDNYLVSRYGDFVLYRPRFNASTVLLWLGPFVLLAICLAYGFRLARRSEAALSTPDDESLTRAKNLLE